MSKAGAIKLRDNLISVMSRARLELRKWLSNDPESIGDVHSDNNSTRAMGELMTKILGLHWKSDDVVLFYTVQQVEVNVPITKRKILSEITTIFDPLGLLGPVIIIGKIIMQSLWQIKINWDDVLPDEICAEWQRYRNGLPSLNNLKIPRKIISTRTVVTLIKMIQRKHFQKEINELKSQKAQVAGNSVLVRLRPFCDGNGLLRVGGRLANATDLSEFQRHPIVLPRDSTYTRLLFQSEHVNLLHSGPQALVASIRQQYWPLGARKIVHSCITCFKQKPIIVQPIMGNLPRDRIMCSRPFSRCGVDFAGPVMIKSSLRRNSPCDKGYISIFVCFATKAIHIELVSDLTTKAFLQTLNRFFDRRGRCAVIYSDNATNFAGARRQLRDVYNLFQSDQHQNAVCGALAEKAAVKSMKNLLFKVLGESRLTYEEMSTVLTRVEACLNSRPIISLSSDPSDLSYLTPGHFLIGDAITSVPERDETTTAVTPLERWRRVTQYSQLLWKRWSTEYLGQLQERTKWTQSKGPNLKVVSVVLIRDTNLPPLQWRLGRVLQIHAGSDGVSRSASVKTNFGEITRVVRLLCPLPFDDNQ
ncbi:hypothetical protein QTP88_013125 [Uroleucon formosanum]